MGSAMVMVVGSTNGGKRGLPWRLTLAWCRTDVGSCSTTRLPPPTRNADDDHRCCVGCSGRRVNVLHHHPSADPAECWRLIALALIAAARFAAASSAHDGHAPPSPCAPLLFLLRRIAVEPQPSDAQNDHYQFPLAAGQVACENNVGSRLEAGPPPVLLSLCSQMSHGGDEKPAGASHGLATASIASLQSLKALNWLSVTRLPYQ
jgi:hypothetical protein